MPDAIFTSTAKLTLVNLATNNTVLAPGKELSVGIQSNTLTTTANITVTYDELGLAYGNSYTARVYLNGVLRDSVSRTATSGPWVYPVSDVLPNSVVEVRLFSQGGVIITGKPDVLFDVAAAAARSPDSVATFNFDGLKPESTYYTTYGYNNTDIAKVNYRGGLEGNLLNLPGSAGSVLDITLSAEFTSPSNSWGDFYVFSTNTVLNSSNTAVPKDDVQIVKITSFYETPVKLQKTVRVTQKYNYLYIAVAGKYPAQPLTSDLRSFFNNAFARGPIISINHISN